ncbi:MAG TPA: DUF1598 domain-containing protein [Planctomycetota bacterium]|nr:DUF1598 domain-containing protein [Planctomycetota bacterium]
MKLALQALGAILAFAPAVAWAQGRAWADPQGVFMDDDGVLRRREKDDTDRLAEIRKRAAGKEKDGQLVYVSLPRVLAEAKKCLDAGQPIPDKLRYLGGMTRLQYVFVYPDEGDIVIAGPAEPFDTKVPYRPLGEKTGRPVIHLDDLVTAMRAAGPGQKPQRIGCDIEVTKEIAERCAAKLKEVAPKAQEMGVQKAAEEIAKAGGNQAILYYTIPQNSRFAFVCAEADYLLKQLALGLYKSPVSKVRSYNDMITKPERHHRFSLESQYDSLLVSADGNAYEFRGPSLKVNTGLLQRLGQQDGEVSPAAQKFMDGCNKNWDEMSRGILSWSDLANLGDLTVLAALIGKDQLHTKSKWDIAWVMDPNGYPVKPIDSPKSAHRLCNYHYGGNMLLFTHGGVLINPQEWAAKQVKDDEGKFKRPTRPDGEVWIPTK